MFGNVLGQVEIKGVVRCFDDSGEKSRQRKILNINIEKVDTVTVSNFFIKDTDNSCDVNFFTHGASNFIVKESKFQKNITGKIMSHTCIRNSHQARGQSFLLKRSECLNLKFPLSSSYLSAVFCFFGKIFIPDEVPCPEVFREHRRLDYTIKIVMSIIGLLGVMSLSFIITRTAT